MGRGSGESQAGVAVGAAPAGTRKKQSARSREIADIARNWPMNSIMLEISEELEDADGGIECPHGDGFFVAQGADAPYFLIGSCPTHGKFSIDVHDRYQELVDERIDDEAYQAYA